MPLSEFLRLAIEKLESSKRKSCSSDLSSRTENDVVELVRENGQIIMQGQSNKVTRTPTHQNRVSDATLGNSITASIEKFGGVESIVDDIAIDDGLQDYSSELLPEICSVTAKGISAGNRFVLGDKGSNCDQTVSDLDNDEDAFKFSSSTKARSLYSWLPQQGQASEPSGISGVPCIITNNTSNRQDSIFGICDQGRDVVSESSSMKMESRNVELPRNNSSFLNFSCLSRPVNHDKANLPFSSGISSVSSGVERMEVKEKGSASRCSNLVEPMDFYVPSAPTVVKEPKESFLAEFCSDTFLKTDKALIQSNIANSTGVLDGDGTVEPVVASSSVSSGNSADRISHEHTHSSKRKFCDIESECHSDEDIQNESVGVKKPTAARGTTRSRKSRTAEVHNLSERRRRDRINEKMRILQELIPNCNKADKASMLDEAIEYLKNLQLQLQIMSLRASLCIPPLMFPPGTQHMYPVSIPHFSPVVVGMGARMSFGNTNGGFPPHCPIFQVPSFQRPHFPSSALGLTNLQGIPKAPLVPLTGRQQNSATDSSGLTVSSHNKVPNASSNLNSGDPITTKKSQSMRNPEGSSSIKHNLNQVR